MKNCLQIILILILAGCAPNSRLEIATVTPLPFLSTSTSIPTAIWTIIPTITLPPTSTAIPSHPISTPSARVNSEITLELLRTNNNCELPCWWGIIPNQTSWSDAEKLLEPFSDINLSESSAWSVYFVHSPISKEFSETYEVNTVFAVQQGLVKEIEISGFNEKSYNLSSILMKYGIPSQVLLSAYSSDYGLPPNQVPLSIDLYYPDKGVNVLYGTYATVKDAKINGCLENPHLFLWSPSESNRSIDYILGWDKSSTPYMSINKATELDIQGFYEKYVNPDNEPCLETPTNLWPAQ